MKLKCPECESQSIKNEGDSVMSCKDCDLIFDSGPKWTSYNPETIIETIPQEQNISSKTIMKWQKETRTGNLASKSILLASDEIERIAFDLKVNNSIKDLCGHKHC